MLLSGIALSLAAQGNGFDMQVMSGQDISGTSRYVGMAGAMAAVGGDVSAVKDNPAGLGLLRNDEVLFTIEYQASTSDARDGNGHKIRVPELTWVSNIRTGNRQNGVLQHNLMIGYRRVAAIDNEWHVGGKGMNSSQTDLMADRTNGLTAATLEPASAYNNEDVGWLSKMGYDAWLIDPTTDDERLWTSLEAGLTDCNLMVRESGKIDMANFAWGMNISNNWYVGLGANVCQVTYEKGTYYAEGFESGNSYNLYSNVGVSGIAIGLQAGLLWRPGDHWRMGLAYQSPTWAFLSTSTTGEINSKIRTESGLLDYSSEPQSVYREDTKRKMPMRVVTGLAYQLGEKGMLSAEYDYQHGLESGMRDENMVKVGGEVVIKRHLFVNAGYAINLYGTKYKDGVNVFVPGITSARTDTDFRSYGSKHFASVGLAYRNAHWVGGVAYQYATQQLDLYGHCLQETGWGVRQTTHRIVATLAFRY